MCSEKIKTLKCIELNQIVPLCVSYVGLTHSEKITLQLCSCFPSEPKPSMPRAWGRLTNQFFHAKHTLDAFS